VRSTLSTPRTLSTRNVPVAAVGVTTLVFADLPAAGYGWDLRRLVLVDAEDMFRIHCDAIACLATPNDPGLDPLPLEAAAFGIGIPLSLGWSRGTIMLRGGEAMVIWISGADAGRKLFATVQIEETRRDDFT